MHPKDHDYSDVMLTFEISSLASLRKVKDSIMAYKLFVGKIDCQELYNKFVNRDLPYELRQFRPFLESIFSSRPKTACFYFMPPVTY